MDEKKEKKKNAIPGVIEKKDKNGNVTAYKFMRCVGRDETYKQIWRTCTVSASDPRLKDPDTDKILTPAKLRKQLSTLKGEWDNKVQEEYDKSHAKTVDKKSTTFSEFVNEHWLKDHVKGGKLTTNSVEFFTFTSKSSLDYFGKTIKLTEITPELVKKYLNHLSTMKNKRGKKFSSTSQMHNFGTFRNIMGYAYRMGYIEENPCDRISEAEAPKRKKHSIDFLEPADAKRFLACADEDFKQAEKKNDSGTICRAAMWRCYLYLLITTGLRRGEAVGLQWGDIDHKKMTIKVERSVCINKVEESGMEIKSTKTGDIRKVALLETVYNMLMGYQMLTMNYFNIEEMPPDAFIFCSESSIDQPIFCTSPTRHVSSFVKRYNLPNVSPHDLRHTAASLALESGAGIKEISELMGHSDIGTTSKFYAALTQEAKRRTIEGIGDVLFSNSSQNENAKSEK